MAKEDYSKISSLLKRAEEEGGLKGLTSLTIGRGKDIPRKKFLVELEEGNFNKLNAASDEEGISRNLLVNLLVDYYLANQKAVTEELLKMR